MPVANASSHPHSYSSSEEMSPGKRMFKRFESFVKRPISGEKLHSVKQQLIRSTWILRHKSPSFMSALSAKQSETSKALKTCSLDRKDMPNLKQIRSSGANNTVDETFPVTHDVHTQNGIKNATNEDVNKNEMKSEIDENESSVSSNEDNENVNRDVEISRTKEKVKDIDHTLDADVNDHEQFEQTSTESQMSGTKGNHHICVFFEVLLMS
ncbi:hypothetical protein DPMN_096184 [Dreissena polymorpha]|uniref:Uncharacterized protein n=1 Tax=Dreissena polymorpha TaxID=45954 RepID=A0A9D4R4I2_DREPO|nr:hypothetical protein DPMN_096184 [Dreissena polymorpha]